jgi:hypothetical protein
MRNLFIGLMAAAMLMACDKPAEQQGGPKAAPAEAAPALAMVEVPKDGKEFNPPVKPEQIPAGAFYCDMGTVEYARLDKGDGKCPVCGMMLKQKPGGAEAPAAPAAGHEGHAH